MSSTVIEFPMAPSVARRPAPAGSVRLTRRGRVVLLVAAVLLALAAGVVLSSGSEATSRAGTPVPTEIVVVQQGDTLWGLASEVAEDGRVREAMAEIQRLNALDTKVLQLGQKLRVPLTGK